MFGLRGGWRRYSGAPARKPMEAPATEGGTSAIPCTARADQRLPLIGRAFVWSSAPCYISSVSVRVPCQVSINPFKAMAR